jgi:hypothetical protein
MNHRIEEREDIRVKKKRKSKSEHDEKDLVRKISGHFGSTVSLLNGLHFLRFFECTFVYYCGACGDCGRQRTRRENDERSQR